MIAAERIPDDINSSAGRGAPDSTVDTSTLSPLTDLRIVIAGGGTGGHLFPGIAMASGFVARNAKNRLLFVSSGNPFEHRTLAREGYDFKTVRAAAFKGKGWWHKLKSLATLPMGVCGSILVLQRFKPELVIGLGSYSAAPVILAAWLLRKKIVLHEQNTLPGVTNRILARFADLVCISFAETADRLSAARVTLTGNPVRPEFMQYQSLLPPDRLDSGGSSLFNVLIIGGSQGAHGINLALIDALDHLPMRENYRFVHQTGQADLAAVQTAYVERGVASQVDTFFIDMVEQYRRADLVICRAGATTVAELTAMGKPALLIPFPFAADNHQARNAGSLVDAGAAEMILQSDLTGKKLAMRLDHFRRHPERLTEMSSVARSLGRIDATQAIVDRCYEIVGRK